MTSMLTRKLLIRMLSPLALLFIASFTFQPLHAQTTESDGMNTGSPGFFSIDAEIRAETSATLVSWNPEALTGLVAVRYEYPEGYYQVDDPVYFTLKPEPTPGIVFGPPLKAEPLFKDGHPAEYHNETTVLIEFRASQETGPQRLAINALFRICDYQGVCLFPDSELQYVDFNPAAPALEPNESILAILDWSSGEEGGLRKAALAGTDISATGGAEKAGLKPLRILLILLMALAGGVLLNIMPCILPLLSVKTLNLVNQAGLSGRAIFKHSLLYVAGIETSLLALAAVVIALQASGRLLGWGFQLQSPLFVLILIAIIWVFSLSLFDVYVIEAPRGTGINSAGKRGGFLGSFLTGMFAVLIAAPCTAPLLGPVLGFAFSQTAPVIIAIFGLIGLGFGFPFLLLGAYPGLGEKLPKPGPWMNTFKGAMGFLLIGIVVYLFTTFIELAPTAVGGALWWLLFLGFAAWLLGKARGPLVKSAFRFAGQFSALLIAVASGFLFVDLSNTGDKVAVRDATESSRLSDIDTQFSGEVNTIAFDEQELQALIAAGKPIFLEFSAEWCTVCKVNQRVIKHRRIRSLMIRKGITHIKADLTAYDETLVRALAGFGRASLPLYVLYSPGEKNPHILPALLSVRKLSAKMEEIR